MHIEKVYKMCYYSSMRKVNKTKKQNHKIKDTVFTKLFDIPKYRLELYKSLHPKDKDVKIEDVKKLTLEKIFTNGIYNDLGMLVKNRILFLMEEQSSWSINILVRDFIYLGETFLGYIKMKKLNIYGTKKIDIPIPELYVLYTGKDKLKKKTYSLNEEFYDGKSPIDLRIKVITTSKKNDILSQYLTFIKMSDEYRIKDKSVKELLDTCIKKDILKEFIEEHYKEVVEVMDVLFNQDWVTKVYEESLYNEGKEEGIQEGIQQGMQKGIQQGMQKGMLNILVGMVKDKLLSVAEAAKRLGVSEREFSRLAKV